MNILFANYGDFTTNSLNHLAGFARELAKLGHACAIAVPQGMDTLGVIPNPRFRAATHDQVLADPAAMFPDGRPADIVHAWTPRETVRKFVVAHQRMHPARLVVHLEDNEEFLIERYTGLPFSELRGLSHDGITAKIPDALSHPLRHRNLLRLADGATVIVEALRRFVPAQVPATALSPGVDFQFYRPQPADPALRTELGLRPDERVLVFTGSTTHANESELRELYRAVHLLNRGGTPVRLVRTGFGSPSFMGSLGFDAAAFTTDLGFIAKERLPGLLALADALVQPGRPGPFNDFRLPSKIPEFLAMGRAVVLPAANAGLALRDGEDALLLREGTAEEIAAACARIFADPELAAKLGRHGLAFARAHYDPARNTAGLAEFYAATLARQEATPWLANRNRPAAGDVSLLAAQLAGRRPQPAQPDAWNEAADDLVLLCRQLESEAAQQLERLHLSEDDRKRWQHEFELARQHAANLETLLAAARQRIAVSEKALEDLTALHGHTGRELQLTHQHAANLEALLESARRQADIAKEELAEAQTRREQIHGQMAALRQTSADLASGRDRGAKELESAGKLAAGLESRLETVRQELADAEKKLADLTARHEHTGRELQLTHQHAANLETLLESARRQIAVAEQELNGAKTRREQADRQLAELRQTLTDLSAERDRWKTDCESVRQLAAGNEARLQSVRRQFANAEKALAAGSAERAALGRQLAGLQQTVAALTDERGRAKNDFESVRKLATGLETRLESVRRQLADSDNELAAANAARAGLSQELETLRGTLAETRATAERLPGVEAVLRSREAKITRLRESFSWRITAPLRALRRALVDPLRAKAPPPVFSKKIQFSVDAPVDWGRITPSLHLRGWALHHDRLALTAVRVRLGGNIIAGEFGLDRPDVHDHFRDHPGAARSGWSLRVAAPRLLPRRLVLEVRDGAGVWHAFFERKVRRTMRTPPPPPDSYAAWIAAHDTLTPEEYGRIRGKITALQNRPLISVLMPVYNAPEKWLVRAIGSVREQLYDNWELCVADDASTAPHVRKILRRCAARDPRIKVVFRGTNGHISAASNSALELARGEFVALFDHDDELRPHALACVALELARCPDADVIYSDEDKIDENGRRYDHYFKPDWNPDLLLAQNYISHLGVYRTALVREVGGFRAGYEGSQDWDLVLRVTERSLPERIRHIPKILYHWRAIAGSTAVEMSAKNYAVTAAEKALLDHFGRTGSEAVLSATKGHYWRAHHPLPNPAPRVTLVIPTRNRVELLRLCIGSILEKSTYPDFEIMVVDNGSDEAGSLAYLDTLRAHPRCRVVTFPGPFNYSALNNFAVRQTDAPVIGLLNNDLEIITPGWLEEMVSHAVRPGIGAVGAMLYYPDDRIQQAGVILGVGGVAAHGWQTHPRGTSGHAHRALLQQNLSAVTAACLVIRREIYLQVGGLDEDNLKVAFNDVDFCLKVRTAGYRNLWTPFAELYHHESASRGEDDTPEKQARFRREIDHMLAKWGPELLNDPAYNPNLTLHDNNFTLATPPRPWPPLA